MPEIEHIYVGDPSRYFYGVATKVHREYLRKGSEFKFQEYLAGARDDEYLEKQLIKPEEDLIALALIGNRVKPVALTADGTYRFLDSAQNLHNVIYVASVESLSLKRAVEELETLVNDSKTKESQLQEFFERNPKLIVNDDYKAAHPHVVLSRNDGIKLIPDFLLEPTGQNSLCDLLELKLPASQIFVTQSHRARFSSGRS